MGGARDGRGQATASSRTVTRQNAVSPKAWPATQSPGIRLTAQRSARDTSCCQR